MMTPQEVASCTFAKAVVNGYNMAAVDDFLDKLTEDYSTLYKENAALKSKLKVVADKMKEYREMEDTMRATLLTAQKMATSIVTEAEQKRTEMIADAASAARTRLAEVQIQMVEEERRLTEVRERVDRELEAEKRRLIAGQEQLRIFIRDVTAVCNSQLALLDRLPELPADLPKSIVSVPAPAPAPAEESVPQEAPPEEKPAEGIAKDLEDVISVLDMAASVADEAMDEVSLADDEPVVDAADLDDDEVTRVINLDDLQFGRNYMKD